MWFFIIICLVICDVSKLDAFEARIDLLGLPVFIVFHSLNIILLAFASCWYIMGIWKWSNDCTNHELMIHVCVKGNSLSSNLLSFFGKIIMLPTNLSLLNSINSNSYCKWHPWPPSCLFSFYSTILSAKHNK